MQEAPQSDCRTKPKITQKSQWMIWMLRCQLWRQNLKMSPLSTTTSFTVLTRVTDENSALRQENEELKRNEKTVEILNELMKPSANKAFYYMFIYSGAVGLILLMNAFGCFANPLDPGVMKTLVGSTAVTVIGLVGMVLTGVFVGARNK